MDLEQQLIRRRKELDDQKSILQRLRNAKRTESDIEQHAGLKSSNGIDGFGSEIRGNTFSTVNHVHQVGVNFPPLSSDGAMHSRAVKAKKTFADVLGDEKFSYGAGPLHGDEEVGAQEASVDANLDQDDVNELSSKALASRVTLRDEKWSIHRPVSALRFHQKHEDLLLSAHAASSVATSQRSGVVNVWALDGGDSRLQRTLIANASMTSLVLPSISPATVVGGTYGGDILTWDLRARASTPAQRAGSFSVDPDFSHSCSPIFSLEMASGNKAELISASANGTICIWSLSNLDSPVMKFQVRNQSLTGTIRVTALEVPGMKKFMGGGRENKSSQCLFAGGEDGGVYRFENQSGSWGLGREIAAHKAPVTSLSVHPTSRKWPQLSDIVLSASMDWSIQLCYLGQGSSSGPPKTFSIGMPGIISDVKWSPVHPCIFASGDEAGGVSLFDAERSYMNSGPPSCRHTFKEYGSSASATSSITRLQWSKDGGQLSAGDIEGSVSIWRCSENIADSSSQEWERMSDFLKRRSDK